MKNLLTFIAMLMAASLTIYSIIHRNYMEATFYTVLFIYTELSLQISGLEEKLNKLIDAKNKL